MTTVAEISLDRAADKISGTPAPILLPDTCALLDLIRLPLRAKDAAFVQAELDAVKEIKDNILKNKLWIVFAPLVHKEWRDNRNNIFNESATHFSKLDSEIAIAQKIDDFFNSKTGNAVKFSSLKLQERLMSLGAALFDSAIFLLEDRSCRDKAYTRAINNTPPARKGSLIDCVIIEHSIELCDKIRKRGSKKEAVFLTSNINDFCEPGRTEVKQPLKSQFQGVNLKFATKWQWTKIELGI